MLSWLVRDLPDVSAGVAKARRADPPRPIHRPVQQLDPAFAQPLAYRVHVLDAKRELKANAGVRGRNRSRRDKAERRARSQQIHECSVECEHGGIAVLEGDGKLKDILVEALRPLKIFHEQRDGGNTAGPGRLWGALFSGHAVIMPHLVE